MSVTTPPSPRTVSVAQAGPRPMSDETRRLAGILFVTFPSVVFGGASLLSKLVFDPTYPENPLRQDLWRAGHAHAAVLLVLSLIALRYVDDAVLSTGARRFAALSIPVAAILMPVAFFLSMMSPAATEPNALIYLAYVGGVLLLGGLVVLGVGLLRRPERA